ncbi:uncharacterized protein LOC141617918 [Silene latifolia]|uniref:uncharacterized protein LOC141617918 n=1 Tax=Silene latifolia TaxID=37657 RepID=UPI003D776F15
MFDNKPVIVKEWSPNAELIKHDISVVPIWMKLYGLDIKFWGSVCLQKICGLVGKLIKCDDATTHKAFLGYARVMVEVRVGQTFPSELVFLDELGNTQRIRVVYDWLPLSCVKCKGMGHLADHCRKENGAKVQKVWTPKSKPKAPTGPKKTPKTPTPVTTPKPVSPVVQLVTASVPVRREVSGDKDNGVPTGGKEQGLTAQSAPRRFLTRMLRNEVGEARIFTPRGITFMDALTLSIQKVKTDCQQKMVDMIHTGAQCIHTKVKDMMQGFDFYFTLVYGFNKAAERQILWQELRNYATTANGPWLVGGDFNSIMKVGERIGGSDVTLAEI